MSSRTPPTETLSLSGPAGQIDTLLNSPAKPDAPRGIALVCHPHPLYGGANTNKVAHTLARTFSELGYATLRPNFRGVGKSTGQHDQGLGETDDMLALLEWARSRWGELPLVLGGFSFGAFVQTRVAAWLAEQRTPATRIVLVGTAAGSAADGSRHYDTGPLPAETRPLLIHGELDETVPLINVFEWARPQSLPVVVIPGADHFFHGKLNLIRDIIRANWALSPEQP